MHIEVILDVNKGKKIIVLAWNDSASRRSLNSLHGCLFIRKAKAGQKNNNKKKH